MNDDETDCRGSHNHRHDEHRQTLGNAEWPTPLGPERPPADRAAHPGQSNREQATGGLESRVQNPQTDIGV